jgi:hypothetical protein
LASTPLSARASRNQARQAFAFVRVSRVVKVFEATMNRTVSGSTPRSFSPASEGSMFDMNRHSRPSWT